MSQVPGGTSLIGTVLRGTVLMGTVRGRRRRLASPIVALILAALTACAVLTGCSSGGSSSSSGPSASANGTRVITDMAGRKVTIPAHVTRVASDYNAMAQVVFMLGYGSELVATNQDTAPAGSLFATVDPAMAKVATPFSSDTTQVNIESLLAARPDLVFVVAGDNSMVSALSHAGIPSVEIDEFTGPSNLEAGVSLVGNILGGSAPGKAKAYASFYNSALAKAATATATVPASQRPTVFYAAGSPTVTEGQGSIVTAWINEGGGVNVAAEHGIVGVLKTVNLEDVIGWDPDYIVCRDPDTKAQILNDPRWKDVTAVRDHHVVIDPQGVFVWGVRSAEAALQPLWTAQLLHPSLISQSEMDTAVKSFYSEFYSYSLSASQLSQLLNPPA